MEKTSKVSKGIWLSIIVHLVFMGWGFNYFFLKRPSPGNTPKEAVKSEITKPIPQDKILIDPNPVKPSNQVTGGAAKLDARNRLHFEIALNEMAVASSSLNFHMILQGSELIPGKCAKDLANLFSLNEQETQQVLDSQNRINSLIRNYLAMVPFRVQTDPANSFCANVPANGMEFQTLTAEIERSMPENSSLRRFFEGYVNPMENLISQGISYQLQEIGGKTIETTVVSQGRAILQFIRPFRGLAKQETDYNVGHMFSK